MHAPKRRSSSSTNSSSSSRAAMRFLRLSYIAAGSIGAGSAFLLDFPFVVGAGAAGYSWRADPDGGVGAGNVGGGFAVRGEAAGVVAVVVTVPFIAAGRKYLMKGIGSGSGGLVKGPGFVFCVM
jgi:hypothetical protein